MQTHILSYIKDFMISAQLGKILTKHGKVYSPAGIQSYLNLGLWISAYEQETEAIYLEELDLETCDDFLFFLLDNGLAQNTICSIAKRLKAILNRFWRGQQPNFSTSEIVATSEVTTAVYTNLEELEAMAGLELPERLAWIRDVYLVQAFTGQRFGDVKKVIATPERYFRVEHGIYYFQLKTQKTGEEVVIPVASIVRQVFERRGTGCFDDKYLYYQQYNKQVKEVARLAGMVHPVELSRTMGGVRKDWTVQKWEAISSHTARRSFATNAYLAGMDLKKIAAFTGHRQLSTLMIYIRCTAMEVARQAASHPFFTNAFSLPVSNRSDTTAP